MLVVVVVAILLAWSSVAHAGSFKVWVPLLDGRSMPAYCFIPDYPVQGPLPAVIHGVGVGAQLYIQHHVHCQELANRNFFVMLIDPSAWPEWLLPGPFTWNKFPTSIVTSLNQGMAAAKIFFNFEWYVEGLRAATDYLCGCPLVDRNRIAISGYSQPANAALTCATRDPRIKAIVWNYGGSPWIMPYNACRLPPVQIFHGTEDEVYHVRYALDLAANLAAANRYYQLYIYPGQKHLFTIYYDLETETRYSRPVIQDSFEKLVSFLYLALQPPPPPPLFSVARPGPSPGNAATRKPGPLPMIRPR